MKWICSYLDYQKTLSIFFSFKFNSCVQISFYLYSCTPNRINYFISLCRKTSGVAAWNSWLFTKDPSNMFAQLKLNIMKQRCRNYIIHLDKKFAPYQDCRQIANFKLPVPLFSVLVNYYKNCSPTVLKVFFPRKQVYYIDFILEKSKSLSVSWVEMRNSTDNKFLLTLIICKNVRHSNMTG